MQPRGGNGRLRRSCYMYALLLVLVCVCVHAARSASVIHATTHALELLPAKRLEVQITAIAEMQLEPEPPKQEEICADPAIEPDAFLVIGVKSSVLRGVEARQAIRQTWGNGNLTQPLGVRVVFLGGEPDFSMLADSERSHAERTIADEKATYQDLLTHELQCHDSFYTLVDKVVAFLAYANATYPTLVYAMVADDDVYVILDRLVALLKSERIPSEGFYGGNAGDDRFTKPTAPIRDASSRYYLPLDMYPLTELPPFVAGAQYIVSRDVVEFVALNRYDLQGLKGLDDATMAVWLLALQIHPVFLREFQILRTWPCTEGLISYADLVPPAIREVHLNLIEERPFCTGYSLDQWMKAYRTIDYDADNSGGGTDGIQTSWDIELDPVSKALQISTTITVNNESVVLVYVPSSGPFKEVFCERMLPLLEAKLSILAGRDFCRQQRHLLLQFVNSHDASIPTMRPLLALTRHNLLRDASDDELAQRSETVVVALAPATTRSVRVVVECVLVRMSPETHLVVVSEEELGDRSPHFVVVSDHSDEARVLRLYPNTQSLVIADQGHAQNPHTVVINSLLTPTHPRQLYLPGVSTTFGSSVQHRPGELLQASAARVPDPRERSFCAYDNDDCELAQQQLMFDLLNEVQSVEALGVCTGSSESEPTRPMESSALQSLTPVDDTVEAYTSFKFVLAFEDAVDAPGLVSHKIAAAFLAGAIPVYLGHSASVSSLFNVRAFIDCGSFTSLQACASKVLHVHHSSALYEAMRREPPVVNTTAFVETFSWHPDVADMMEAETISHARLSLSHRLQQLLQTHQD